MEWKTVKLGDVLTVKYGKDHKALADGDTPVYGSGGIMRYADRAIYDKPSILIPRKGSLNNIFYVDKPFWTVDTMFWSIIDTEKADPHFLFYAICKMDFAGLNVGSAVPSLTVPVIEAVELAIPALEDQRRIAAILSSLDDKIENNNRINANLEAQAQALFKSWFVDFEPWGGVMPDDWNESTLGEICKIKYGKGLSTNLLTNEGYPVFGGNGVIGYYTKFLYELPQILVSCRGAASGKIMESDPLSFVTSNSLVLEMKDRAYYYYLKYLLFTNPLYNYATGSAQPQITIDNIKDVDVVLPSIGVADTISEKFAVIDEQIRILRQESTKLAKLRDTLLPKLMKGEIAL